MPDPISGAVDFAWLILNNERQIYIQYAARNCPRAPNR